MASFRDFVDRVSPPWLQGAWGSRYLYSIGVVMDALGDALRLGVEAQYPTRAPVEAIPYIARDRRILRGFAEPLSAYRQRLVRWLDDWRRAGSAYAILDQVAGYLSPSPPRMRLVNARGGWYTREPDGTTTFQQSTWNWDGDTASWCRFWLIIYAGPWAQGPDIGDPELWGGAIGSPGYTIGTTATPEQVATIRRIAEQWKSAPAKCEHIIIAFDPSSFDPEAPEPDGTWGQIMTSGDPRVPTRLQTARYWRGPR